jgi:hypothetical protein
VEIGTFQPSFGFKDFRRAARLHSPTNGQFGREKRVRLRPPPRPQLQGFSSSGLRRRSAPSGGLPPRGLASRFFLPHLGVETILQLCGGGVLQPCRGRRTVAAQPGCSIPSSARATAVSHTRGSHNTSYTARAVLVFWDGPILVFVARTGVRTCRCALGGQRSLVRCWWAGGGPFARVVVRGRAWFCRGWNQRRGCCCSPC